MFSLSFFILNFSAILGPNINGKTRTLSVLFHSVCCVNFWSVSVDVVLFEVCKMHNKKLIAAFFIVVQKSLFF